MNETVILIFATLAGLALGAIFFGGLWWTVRMCVATGKAALWMFGSFLLRMSVALAGFYFVSSSDWKRLLACLIGFLMARLLTTWLTRLPETNQTCRSQENTHAS